MNLQLAWPWMLLALPLPLLIWRFVPRAEKPIRPADALCVPFYDALIEPAGLDRRRPSGWSFGLAVLVWLLLVVSAARPQVLGEPVELPLSGRDLMLAVDVSGSMREEDMIVRGRVVDRLVAVKAVAGDFIERREGDRIGLILFGEQAYLQVPLTFDRETAQTLLLESAVGLAGRETAIGDAIGLAIKRLRDSAAESRVLVLLTDGANTAGRIEPQKAAEIAAEAGLRIHTIGVGGESRSPFGLSLGSNPLDESSLQAIAEQTGGRYFRARDVGELEEIYALLDRLEPLESERQILRPVDEFYSWPLGAALLLSVLLLLLRTGLLAAWRARFSGANA